MSESTYDKIRLGAWLIIFICIAGLVMNVSIGLGISRGGEEKINYEMLLIILGLALIVDRWAVFNIKAIKTARRFAEKDTIQDQEIE